MPLLLLAFIVIPLVELALLVYMGSVVGFWPTITLVVVTGFVGFALFKHEWQTLKRQWVEVVEQGQTPYEETLEGLLLLLGAAFLFTPGLLTDVTGFCLVVPFTRKCIRQVLVKMGKTKLKGYVVSGNYINIVHPFQTPQRPQSDDEDVQDAEFIVKD